MSSTVHHIPLADIDAEAVMRDRTRLDPEALAELKVSIARTGLRQPIEVFELAEGHEGHRFGLVSGFRRLRAFRELAAGDPTRVAAIPAFVRTPASVAEVLAGMVEENEIRADLSPWERSAVAVRAVRHGHFESVADALRALYPSASRHKRGRLRLIAELVDDMDGLVAEPERLSERECLRYAAAVAAGLADLIEAAVGEAPAGDHDAQWAKVLSVIREAEAFPAEHPVTPAGTSPARVRRLWKAPRHRLVIRRERTPGGFVLHVTGRDATTPLVNEIFDEVERRLSPG